MLAERVTATSKHRAFFIAEPSLAGSLLGADLAIRTADLSTVPDVRGTLPCFIAFEDHGAVQDVSPEREVQVGGWVIGETEGLHEGKGVDRCKYFGGWGRGAAHGDRGCQGRV